MNKKFIIFYFITLFMLFHNEIYSNNFSRDIIGYSLNNRDIEVYKFGQGNELLVIVAGIHGNESNTTKTAYSLIELLTDKKIKIPSNKSVWIIPEANPDGLARDRRLNDNDVDLNRNFDTANWKPYFYFFNNILSAGNKPFSEPESRTLKYLFEGLKESYIPIALSLHSRGGIIIPGNNLKQNLKLCKYIEKNSNFFINDIGYSAAGDLTAWLSNELGIPSATIEFKSKTDNEVNEIKKIVTAILKLDYVEEFYVESADLIDVNGMTKEKLTFALSGLPQDIIDGIILSDQSSQEFIDYYNAINDDELLLLVDKENRIPKDYIPMDLVLIDKEFPATKNSLLLRNILISDLRNMFSDARKENINLVIISAYRSFETQEKTFANWKKTLGYEEASRVSALPGTSQHQLGTTIDFNSLESKFGKTREGIWLARNAYKYGFIMSYPEGKEELTGYAYEPWHFRYIGKPAAFLTYKYFNNILDIFL